MRALACPASYKGALSAPEAAAALAAGLRGGGVDADECPVADGGEGTAEVLRLALGGTWHEAGVHDPLGRPIRARWLLLPDGTGVVEAAAALGLPLVARAELDPLRASSAGFGELIAAALDTGASSLLLCLGGTATVDGGLGLRTTLARLRGSEPLGRVRVVAACDVGTRLGDAARLFGPQKGASPVEVAELERRLAADEELRPFAALPGSGAAGGLGAATASLGAELRPGAAAVLEAVGFGERLHGAALAVTGEGELDGTTAEGKAPAEVARVCAAAGVRCVVAAGRVRVPLAGAEARELSGDPAATARDLMRLGGELAAAVLGGA